VGWDAFVSHAWLDQTPDQAARPQRALVPELGSDPSGLRGKHGFVQSSTYEGVGDWSIGDADPVWHLHEDRTGALDLGVGLFATTEASEGYAQPAVGERELRMVCRERARFDFDCAGELHVRGVHLA
jgi:hypothetical protein